MPKLVRITTVPLSLEKLLEGQLTYMQQFYEVTAISADKPRLEKYGKENGVNIFHVEMTREITPFQDIKALNSLYKYFRKEKPLLVHTHTPKAGILGMLAAKMAGIKIRLHTVAGMPLMETTGVKRKILNIVEKTTYSCASRIYPNSHGLKEIILNEGFTAESKLKVLGNGSSNGIDTDYFNPEKFSEIEKTRLKKEYGIPLEDLIFIFVGRLVADKGINELIGAFINTQKKHSNCSLLLVGPFEQDLDPINEEKLRQINMHPKIFSVGYQVDVRSYFAVSDVLVFPSYREGFPNVVMQAGAMGLPSIVTNINGCNEIIEEGLNGTIVPVKNETALQMAMQKIIHDARWRKGLKEKSRKRIATKFDRQQFWKLLLEEYKLLENRAEKQF